LQKLIYDFFKFKIMILFEDDFDPAMRYEGLARFAFDNCARNEDPWGYSRQDIFGGFVPVPTINGKRALSAILNKLIWDKRQYDELKDQLLKLEETIWEAKTQEEIIRIIDYTIQLLKE
jgi:hypothetical protein